VLYLQVSLYHHKAGREGRLATKTQNFHRKHTFLSTRAQRERQQLRSLQEQRAETEAENTENTVSLLLGWPTAKRSPSPAATALRAAGSVAPTGPDAKLQGGLVIHRGALQVPAAVLPLRPSQTFGWQCLAGS